MKIGLSTYSLNQSLSKGQMTLFEAIDWIAAHGGDSVEFVPFAYSFEDGRGGIDRALTGQVKKRCADAGLEMANYSVLADLCREDDAEFEAEVARVCRQVDIAAELGVPRMRHDVAAYRRELGRNGIAEFDRLLPRMVEGARRITDYAKGLGVITMIENHGFFANGCDRVERVLNGVARDNYRLLLDTGNIVCVDEDPSAAAARLAGRAEIVHLKDFYIRRRDPGDSTQFDCEGHWFRSLAGRYLRGAILGQGDLDIYEILGALGRAGFAGHLMIEFEGLEDPAYASAVSLGNARRILGEV